MKKITVIFLTVLVAISVIGCRINIDENDSIVKSEDEISESVADNNDEEDNQENNELESEVSDDQFIQESTITVSTEVQEFYNSAYLINSNVFLRTNQIPMVEDIDTILVMKSEIKEYENELNTLLESEDIKSQADEAELILKDLISLSYEAIEIYSNKLNGEDLKIFEVTGKITEAQSKYLEFATLFDNKKIELAADTKEQVFKIGQDIINKY